MSFRDVAEFFLLRGFEFTHETVREWEVRFALLFAEQLRTKRKGKGLCCKNFLRTELSYQSALAQNLSELRSHFGIQALFLVVLKVVLQELSEDKSSWVMLSICG
jgi:hypothetical protein